ncbi:PI-PLC X domain-containing protein 3 isoform X2 [Linepithema humile]|uniref:PI-PLC X domain-containing protein 3 isoform X2 n=1 Tax=Linepithema humile TaxID=83485 RepID=UPI000623765D|nr:PREDICTED: variant-surface-glycoprotein phospholipase C [Linepithema humile]XP_012232584.1 PREDICTED: variant-surface-glycoprotein phospholipase C [Linepithema humile]XP_012232585.1 PREDICTED: variant-surface-glycoprotein phospholipase C [Linepithema humile]
MLREIVLILHVFCGIALSRQCGKVWVTVSSLWRPIAASDKMIDAELEVNWEFDCPSDTRYSDTQIKVFTADPFAKHNETIEPKLTLTSLEHPRGYYRTNITVGRPPLPGGWNTKNGNTTLPGQHCLDYYAVLYKDGDISSSSCLQIWPTWMYDLRREIGMLPIGSLMIPGTHNSGCYKHGDSTRQDAFQQYLMTQDRDVWTQLVHGIRYLDIRVGYYPSISNGTTFDEEGNNVSRFWVNHDILRMTPLSEILRDVRNFLDAARGEVVIMDFHRFPVGFEDMPNRHRKLVDILSQVFEGLILKPDRGIEGLGPTLNDIWTSGKRLIICYNNKHVVNEYDWLWPPLTQAWGNQQTAEGLFEYLNEEISGSKRRRNSENPLWAVMAELTPYALDLFFNLSGGLRQMADSVNRNLTVKFQEEWWKETNIVATDFFLGNDLISVSRMSNIKKSNIAQWRL